MCAVSCDRFSLGKTVLLNIIEASHLLDKEPEVRMHDGACSRYISLIAAKGMYQLRGLVLTGSGYLYVCLYVIIQGLGSCMSGAKSGSSRRSRLGTTFIYIGKEYDTT